jgi:hypothetical protein
MLTARDAWSSHTVGMLATSQSVPNALANRLQIEGRKERTTGLEPATFGLGSRNLSALRG